MLSILVVTDLLWDNYAVISKRLSVLNEDNTVNIFYSKQTEKIASICSEYMLRLYRRYLDIKNINEYINKNVCNVVDVVLIFTNRTEINNISEYMIKLCEKNSIPFFVFGEMNSGFLYNNDYFESKFKSHFKKLNKRDKTEIIPVSFPKISIKIDSTPTSIRDSLLKLRSSYEKIEEEKRNKAIVLLYDKEKSKVVKTSIKQQKEISYLEYRNRRNSWLKEIVPRS